MFKEKIILASGSPRRKELLSIAGISFEVMVSDAEESVDTDDPEQLVRKLSSLKCLDILDKVPAGQIVLGADTVVSLDGVILGKPGNIDGAVRMLRLIQGRAHDVFTGVTIAERLADGTMKKEVFAVRTEVLIAPLTEQEITYYVSSGEPLDKAGAYGIQGAFSRHVESIRGDYFNVVGLPVHAVYETLKRWRSSE